MADRFFPGTMVMYGVGATPDDGPIVFDPDTYQPVPVDQLPPPAWTRESAPIPMRLCCESCGKLHIDEGEFATKPHHTHACQACGLTWRPAVVCTVGVRFLPGFKNEVEGP